MKKEIKQSVVFLRIMIFILLCFGIPQPVSASERVGTLTIYYHGVTQQGEPIALSGAEFSLYSIVKKRRSMRY